MDVVIAQLNRPYMEVLNRYNVDYILIGEYETSSLTINEDAIASRYPCIFESDNGNMRIYQVVTD